MHVRDKESQGERRDGDDSFPLWYFSSSELNDGGDLATTERIVVGCQLVEGTRQEGSGGRPELGLENLFRRHVKSRMTIYR